MPRSHILARELRGTLVVLLVALLIVWLFAKLNDDRAEAQDRIALARPSTSAPTSTSSTTVAIVDDNQRLCSLAAAFRSDLSRIPIELVDQAGNPISSSNDARVDVGLHPDGDISEDVRQQRTVAAAQAEVSGLAPDDQPLEEESSDVASSSEAAENPTVPPPSVIDTDRIDPLESGLLGGPQELALNFYTAASALRLGLISADFVATADYFADFVQIGEPARWDLEELAESDFADRWTALATQPVLGIDATLGYIEEECSIRIGTGFVYREEPPELPILEEVRVPAPIDPSVDPNAQRTTIAPSNDG